MKLMKVTTVLLLVLALPLPTLATANSTTDTKDVLFKYFDSHGDIVINTFIPPEKIPGGYDVIDKNGRLVERVPKALSKEEIERMTYENREAIAAQKEKDKQREYDINLLRKYSFISDIEAERDRKLQEQKVRISILKGNLTSVRSELEMEYSEAAKVEAIGNDVPKVLQKRIEALESKITTTEELLIKQRSDHEDLESDYETRIARFVAIQEIRGKTR